MKFLRILPLLVILMSTTAIAQIGTWRDHFPYHEGIAAAYGNDHAYVATTLGIIDYNTSDNSIERLSKTNVLSDIGISAMAYNEYNNMLVVGYNNGNLDLLVDGIPVNLSDIERNANIIGDKGIYHIFFRGDLAYLSCGFGIVVIDLTREEVKESYIIGPQGTQIQINAVTIDDTHIYAATQLNGILKVDLSVGNIGDFNNWTQETGLPSNSGPFDAIVAFDNRIFVNSRNADEFDSDTIYQLNNNAWSRYDYDTVYNYSNFDMLVQNGRLLISHRYNVHVFAPGDVIDNVIYSFESNFINSRAAAFDGNFVWIADDKRGMVKASNPFNQETILPQGPGFASAGDMEFGDEDMWVVPSRLTGAWNNPNNIEGVASYVEDEWDHFPYADPSGIDSARNFITLAVNFNDQKNVFAGSWTDGLYQINNGVVTAWNETNSTLQFNSEGGTNIGIGGLDFDNDNNLWVTNSSTSEPVSVYTADGTWHSLRFDGSTIKNKRLRGMTVDNAGNKWLMNKDAGVFVFNEHGTFTDDADDEYRLLGTAPGSGNLPSNSVNCITADIDGEVWVGTNEGIGVFYSPENIYSSDGVDAQQILLEQDGNIQVLLETEIVTAITVDGANRKWIGTSGAGAFLMSDDGTEQIHAFNSSNSPLISDNITDIAINHRTGEVLFGTDQGIISYFGSATGWGDEFGDVYAYPNPVRETYDGPIAIKGLLRNTDIRITDVSGNLVFETTSEGGQAIWDGNTVFGERASTGVYLVFCSDSEGEKTFVTKILLVN
jgi:hypothetical protein